MSTEVDVAHVQRMELELSALRNEISSMERAVGGGASPTAGGLLSPGAARDSELIQLRNEVQTLKKEKEKADKAAAAKAAAEATYGPVGQWDVSAVTDLSFVWCAFSSWAIYGCNTACASFNDDISDWATSRVTTMDSEQRNHRSTLQPLS